jgi:hypothetical protein
MKKTLVILFFVLLGVLPIASMAQIRIYDDVEAGQPFDVTTKVTFGSSPNSITNYASTIIGTNINIQLFTTSNNDGLLVITHDEATVEIPALPEGDYSIEVIITGIGWIAPDTRDISIPRPKDWGSNDLIIYAVNGTKPIFTKTSNTFEYVHLQRNDDPNLDYTLETCTNLAGGIWVPLNSVTATNVTGGVFDEVTHSIPTTNSQTYVQLKVIHQ